MKNNSSGFTLVELLISLAISGLVLTAVYNIFISNNRIYLKDNEFVKIEQSLRSAMDMITREIRMAGYNSTIDINSTSDSSTIIYGRSGKQYQFELYDSSVSDATGDSDIGFKEIGQNNRLVALNISEMKFMYCNDTECNDQANIIDDIKFVKVGISSFSNKFHLNVPDANMTRTVYIRNAYME